MVGIAEVIREPFSASSRGPETAFGEVALHLKSNPQVSAYGDDPPFWNLDLIA